MLFFISLSLSIVCFLLYDWIIVLFIRSNADQIIHNNCLHRLLICVCAFAFVSHCQIVDSFVNHRTMLVSPSEKLGVWWKRRQKLSFVPNLWFCLSWLLFAVAKPVVQSVFDYNFINFPCDYYYFVLYTIYIKSDGLSL